MAVSRERDGQVNACERLVAKAWSDEAFKQRLLRYPAAVLLAEGVAVPEGVEVRIVENTQTLLYFTLPVNPAELSGEQLDQVAGGTGCYYSGLDASGGFQ